MRPCQIEVIGMDVSKMMFGLATHRRYSTRLLSVRALTARSRVKKQSPRQVILAQ